MSEREALLRAICDNPDDDTPRLVFADWLQEHGEEDRAEFIRVQIELARGDKVAELQSREKELLDTHKEQWTESLKEFEGDRTGDYYVFRRGFVEAIGSDGEIMIEEGNRLFALAPIREIVFADEEEFGELAKCKWLLRLHTLDLKGSGLSHGYNPSPLLKSRYLANISTLLLGGEDDNAHLDVAGIEALATNKHLTSLRHLDLSGNWFGADGIPPLADAVWLPGLRHLELEGVGIANEGIDRLAAAMRFKSLRILNLIANSIGERGGQQILNTSWFDQLELLDLRDHLGEDYIDESLTPATANLLKRRFGERVRL